MNKKKCEMCGSSHTVKNCARKGVQLYKCQECGYQFRAVVVVSEKALWDAYQQDIAATVTQRNTFCSAKIRINENNTK